MANINTSREDIKRWLETAKKQKAAFMIVACDTYDFDDYPIYCADSKECLKKYEEHNGKNMQEIMEVYDLSLPIKDQLNENRAKHLP